MKKLFVLFVILTMAFASCQTPQKKGEKFAESYVKSSLYIPESYENIATTVDTAYYSPVLEYRKSAVGFSSVRVCSRISCVMVFRWLQRSLMQDTHLIRRLQMAGIIHTRKLED